jgi:ribosomal protein S1
VDFFGLNAIMDIEGLNHKALVKDVRVGDQFEVELADVNVHSRRILVKALKYLGPNPADSMEASATPALT